MIVLMEVTGTHGTQTCTNMKSFYIQCCSECGLHKEKLPLAGVLLLAKWDVPIGEMCTVTN